MTTNAAIAYGTLMQILESPNNWVTLGEVTSINMPSLQRDTHDATHMESPEAWREFIPGLKNAGEVKLELNFVPASATDQRIRDTFDTDVVPQWRIVFSVPTSPNEAITFSAIVTNYEVTGPVADKMTASLTMKISGKAIWGQPGI